MRRFSKLKSMAAMASYGGKTGGTPGALEPLVDFGHNPGGLGAGIYVPQNLPAHAPLVVVLHGCTQTADQYDHGSGWSALAKEYGFALLYPEQQRTNNPNLCFNWFLPQDSRRDRGEALSIRNMIATMVETHQLDPKRIYITGLSAGGAMANVMLATYPEVFAGGAIIAGLPYGTATSVPQALERMRGQGLPRERELSELVLVATDYRGPWPTISVWHGSADTTVYPSNAEAIIAQWRTVHGLANEPSQRDKVDGYPRQVWRDEQGRDCIESFTITGMAHGTPLATNGPDACGAAGPYMIDKHISSTRHICRSWRLETGSVAHGEGDLELAEASTIARSLSLTKRTPGDVYSSTRTSPAPSLPGASSGVGKVIEDALRAAGLMR